MCRREYRLAPVVVTSITRRQSPGPATPRWRRGCMVQARPPGEAPMAECTLKQRAIQVRQTGTPAPTAVGHCRSAMGATHGSAQSRRRQAGPAGTNQSTIQSITITRFPRTTWPNPTQTASKIWQTGQELPLHHGTCANHIQSIGPVAIAWYEAAAVVRRPWWYAPDVWSHRFGISPSQRGQFGEDCCEKEPER